MAVEVTFLGAGDAFGSGGRLQACILLHGGESPMLLDCGATSMVALKRAGVVPGEIGHVLVTHLHGDHFGGLPYLVLDGQFSRRELSLVVAGPPGIEERTLALMEASFPGSTAVERRFGVEFVELGAGRETTLGPASVTAFEVDHASGAPAYAYRVGYGGKTVAYSGDTAWTPALLDASQDADLFVCEGYRVDRAVKFHLDAGTLAQELAGHSVGRVVLTHPSADALARRGELPFELVDEGQTIVF